MASVLEHKDPDQVDEKTGHRDRKQPLVVNVRRLQSPLTGRRVHTVRRVHAVRRVHTVRRVHRVCVCYLDSFREDEEGCEDEEESVDEASQNLCSDITETRTTNTHQDTSQISDLPHRVQSDVSPVGEAVVGSPPGDDGGCQTCQQSGAVKEHVEGV